MPDWLATIVESALRFFPFPTRPGLRSFGEPGPDSPVFVTCNFDLTVRRVSRALRDLDCYLLVCNSKGINVWCSSSAGVFTAHSVISAIKRGKVGELVRHRQLILPQFSAPGMEIDRIERETGWSCEFGPAYASDIPPYLKAGGIASPDMRLARFPLRDRLEMALMWGFPLSALTGVVLLIIGKTALIPGTLALIWTISLLTLLTFNWLARIDWLPIGILKALLVGLTVVILLLAWGAFLGDWTAGEMIGWSLGAMAMSLVMGVDFEGQSPYLPAAFLAYWGRRWPALLRLMARMDFDMGHYFTLDLNGDTCIGCGRCTEVCPTGIYVLDVRGERGVARLENAAACELCTACIKQCPTGAITAEPPVKRFGLPAELVT